MGYTWSVLHCSPFLVKCLVYLFTSPLLGMFLTSSSPAIASAVNLCEGVPWQPKPWSPVGEDWTAVKFQELDHGCWMFQEVSVSLWGFHSLPLSSSSIGSIIYSVTINTASTILAVLRWRSRSWWHQLRKAQLTQKSWTPSSASQLDVEHIIVPWKNDCMILYVSLGFITPIQPVGIAGVPSWMNLLFMMTIHSMEQVAV